MPEPHDRLVRNGEPGVAHLPSSAFMSRRMPNSPVRRPVYEELPAGTVLTRRRPWAS